MFLRGFGLVSERCLASAGCAKRKQFGIAHLGEVEHLTSIEEVEQDDLADPPKPNVRKTHKSQNSEIPKSINTKKTEIRNSQKSKIRQCEKSENSTIGKFQVSKNTTRFKTAVRAASGRPQGGLRPPPPLPRPPKIRIEVRPKCVKIRFCMFLYLFLIC